MKSKIESHEYFRENILPRLIKTPTGAQLNWCPERNEFWDDNTQNLFALWLIMIDLIDLKIKDK